MHSLHQINHTLRATTHRHEGNPATMLLVMHRHEGNPATMLLVMHRHEGNPAMMLLVMHSTWAICWMRAVLCSSVCSTRSKKGRDMTSPSSRSFLRTIFSDVAFMLGLNATSISERLHMRWCVASLMRQKRGLVGSNAARVSLIRVSLRDTRSCLSLCKASLQA